MNFTKLQIERILEFKFVSWGTTPAGRRGGRGGGGGRVGGEVEEVHIHRCGQLSRGCASRVIPHAPQILPCKSTRQPAVCVLTPCQRCVIYSALSEGPG